MSASAAGERASICAAGRAAGQRAYTRRTQVPPIDLHLDANEGVGPDGEWMARLARDVAEGLARYPDGAQVERALAALYGVEAERLVLTAGADDALCRICQALIDPQMGATGPSAVAPTPTFEMIERYAKQAGGTLAGVPWTSGDLPVSELLAAITPDTRAVFLVSPNNPTGLAASASAFGELVAGISEIGRRTGRVIPLVLDAAYDEFADEPLARIACATPNVFVTRTLSKAWGLAGLRIGAAIAPTPEAAGWLRAMGQPYAVSTPSLAVASGWLRDGAALVARRVAAIKGVRVTLASALESHGFAPSRSQANFVFAPPGAQAARSAWLADALAGVGIAVRVFAHEPISGALRITCPSDPHASERLASALNAALAPRAILFDLDGVLADVSGSYRAAIIATAATYGVALTREDVARAKARGNANNDWVLTQRLLAERGVDRSLAEVTDGFERIYQGTREHPGLRSTETLLLDRATLARLAARVQLAIVTGRPRADAMRFLNEHAIADLFAAVVCMEDGPSKPDPAVVRVALDRLGVSRAWMIGDTVDDVRAARAAGVVPIGVVAPGESTASAEATLLAAGAARVLQHAGELTGLLALATGRAEPRRAGTLPARSDESLASTQVPRSGPKATEMRPDIPKVAASQTPRSREAHA